MTCLSIKVNAVSPLSCPLQTKAGICRWIRSTLVMINLKPPCHVQNDTSCYGIIQQMLLISRNQNSGNFTLSMGAQLHDYSISLCFMCSSIPLHIPFDFLMLSIYLYKCKKITYNETLQMVDHDHQRNNDIVRPK